MKPIAKEFEQSGLGILGLWILSQTICSEDKATPFLSTFSVVYNGVM